MSEPDRSGEAADADLVERMATGNREAFASLFRRYHGLCSRISRVVLDANRVGGPIQAEVVFAEDGLARAIRLAHQDTGRSQ